MRIKKEIIFLSFLLILSLIRFFYRIQERAMFEADQEFLALEAKKIVIDRKFTLIGAPTSVGGMFIGPFYSYLVALLMLIFKMNPYVTNFMDAAWGVLTILGVYLVCLDLLGFKPAVFAGLTALLSFAFLDGTPPLVQSLALTSILIFWSVLKSLKDERYLFLVGLFLGWAFHLHFSAVFFPILVLIYFFSKKISLRFRQILGSLLVLMIFLAPLFLFELRHGFFMSRNFLNFLKSSTEFQLSILSGLRRSFVISLERMAGLFWINNLSAQISLLLLILFFSFKNLWKREEAFFKAVLAWLLLPVLLFSIYNGHIIPYYFTLQEVIIFLLAGLLFAGLWQKKFLRVLIVLFFLIFIKENYLLWFNWKTKRSLKYKIEALEYIKKDSGNQPIYLSHTMEPGAGFGFDYLEWYLKVNKKEDKNLSIYTLVVPFNWHGIKVDSRFGDYGVTLPKSK